LLNVDSDLGLRCNILHTNTGTSSLSAIEIGSLGFPAEFNSIFTGRTAAAIRAKCVFSGPYIGVHGGYIHVSPVSGNGPALVANPLAISGGCSTPMEVYRNLAELYY
jgi:Family of unknown function (DUF5695)